MNISLFAESQLCSRSATFGAVFSSSLNVAPGQEKVVKPEQHRHALHEQLRTSYHNLLRVHGLCRAHRDDVEDHVASLKLIPELRLLGLNFALY